MVLEQVAGLDRLLVAPINQDHAFAVEADEGNLERWLGGGGEQCRHFGTRRMRILRPTGGLADVRVGDVGAAGYFRKQRRLLGAAHDQRLPASRRGAECFELGAAELARGRHLGAATAAPHGRAVERHRVFARADQDVWRPIGHFVSGCARSAMYFAVIIRAGAWSGKRRLGDWSSDGGHWMPAGAGAAPSAALALVRTTL